MIAFLDCLTPEDVYAALSQDVDVNLWHFLDLPMVPTDDFSFYNRVFLQPLGTYCNHNIIECAPFVLSA